MEDSGGVGSEAPFMRLRSKRRERGAKAFGLLEQVDVGSPRRRLQERIGVLEHRVRRETPVAAGGSVVPEARRTA